MARMMKAGLIKRFVPVLSEDSVRRWVQALIVLKVDPASAERLAGTIARLPEVQAVFMTADQGLCLRVALESVADLQTFLARYLVGRRGVLAVTSSQVVTRVVKDEPPSLAPGSLRMDLRCDYCRGEVTSNRPYTLAAGASRYYFCCKTCRKAYLDRYGARLTKARRTASGERLSIRKDDGLRPSGGPA
jgi:DNA-binding Lrp family transcriptional regulator